MSELIAPPASWKFRLHLTAADLAAEIGNHRLLSIKSFLDGTKRMYSAVSVKDEGLGGSWKGRILVSDLKSTLGKKFRLTALDCFEEQRKTFCAAAWIENPQPIQWNWGVDLTANALNTLLEKDDGRLISIRAYKTTLGGKLSSPGLRYCAIWVKNNGLEWGWIPDAIEDSITDTLDEKFARLISIDNLDNTTWLGEDEHFCAVWYKNVTGQVWFWNFGLNKTGLPKEPPKFCSWGLDVSYSTKDRFVSLLEQFPKPADPNLANLMTFSGSGTGTFRSDTWQEIQWNLSQQNLLAEQVSMKSAFMFSAAEGGWSWWSGNFTDPAGQTVLGLPLSLAASQSYNSSPWWLVSNNPKIGLFPIKATIASGKYQFLLAQCRITHPGFSTPALLPINWPVFLGIQAPVEAVKLTNGKNWVTVAGQVINGTGEKLDVTHVSLRLKDQNNVTVHKAKFTNKLLVDLDVLGQPLDPVLTGSVIGSNAPLPKFYDGFEVPRDFKKGKLKVQANVKFYDSKLACYGDSRSLNVRLAPVTTMTRLPHGTPVINGQPDPAFRWHWGNGIGGTNFNAHSYPEHRYSYDIVVLDSNNQSFKDATKKDQNDNYYCWKQPVLAMVDGEVLFVADDFEDHFGNVNNPNSKGANVVVTYNDVLDCYQLYVHFAQNSIVVAVGDHVNAGDTLGLMGNSGGSSEPHLHVGINRRDNNGFMRSLPMTFTKILDSSNNSVSGVPADGGFYSQP